MKKYFYAIFCILFVLFAFTVHRDNARAVSLTFNDYTTGSVINSTELNTNILGRMETAVSQLNTQFVNYTGNDRLSVSLFNTYTGNDKVPYTFFNNYSSGVNTRLTNVNSTNITNRFVNFSTSANNRINNKADSTLYANLSTSFNSRINTKINSALYTNLSTSFDSRIDTKKSAAQFSTYSTGVNGQFAFKAAHSLTNLYVDSTGSPNAYTLDYTPNYTAYSDGMVIIFKAAFENTGSATVNIDGLGAKTLYKDFNGTLASGDILNDQIVTAVYDSTLGGFQIISYSVASGSGSGETNTASNVGDNGVGLFKQKVGSELQFYNMTSTNGSVIFLLNAGANYYDVKTATTSLTNTKFKNYTVSPSTTINPTGLVYDDTPLLQSETFELMSTTFTPTKAGNIMEISGVIQMYHNTGTTAVAIAVFVNRTTANAVYLDKAADYTSLPYYYAYTIPNLNPITCHIRIGVATANVVVIPDSGTRYGNTNMCTLKVQEIAQ